MPTLSTKYERSKRGKPREAITAYHLANRRVDIGKYKNARNYTNNERNRLNKHWRE
jgi:hypothetical protein